MKVLSALLLFFSLSVFAQAPDASKPVTNLVVMVTGNIREVRPMVVQWWHDEDLCKKTARALTEQSRGEREFVCVRLVREDV